MNWEEAYKIIEPIPTEDYIGGRWPDIRYHKMEAFFALAGLAHDGCIVELGTYRGLGAITLTLGASEIVYTVDDYAPRADAAGVWYEPGNEQWAILNAKKAGIQLNMVKGDIRSVGVHWQVPVALLVWDLGTNTLEGDLEAWHKHIVKGGRIAVKDFGFGELALDDFVKDIEFPNGTVYTILKNG